VYTVIHTLSPKDGTQYGTPTAGYTYRAGREAYIPGCTSYQGD